MNSPDNFRHPGLESLKGEKAPERLQPRILAALRPQKGSSINMKILRISLASFAAAALIGGVVLIPRASFASGVKKVAKAFQTALNYKVKSYIVTDGQRRLCSEITVNGENQKVTLYGPDGKPLPADFGIGQVNEKLTKVFESSKPEELLDPALKEKIGKELGDSKELLKQLQKLTDELNTAAKNGGGTGSVSFGTTYVNGKEVKMDDLPPEVKKMIQEAMSSPNATVISVGGGGSNLSYLSTMLKDDRLWDITPNQSLNGKNVDIYRVKGQQTGLVLYVDPATSLPVRMDMTTDLFGKTTTFEDDFDYSPVQP